jgi:outer membrane protein OmpA-like peptidoglycan-associated protein
MKKRFFALLMVFVLVGAAASAQIKQANKLFGNNSFSLALPYYLKIAQKAGDPNRNEAIQRLADCYRLTNDQFKAKAWYAQAVDLSEAKPINWFYYGQALRCTQDYDQAKVAYNKYAELVPSDPRGKAYAAFCAQVEKLTDMPAAYEVKNASNLNSDRSDFGPAFYGEGIIYASDRTQNSNENKNYERTNFNFLDLYFARPRYLDEFYQDMNEPKSFAGQFNQTNQDGPATFAKHDSLIYFSRTEKDYENKDADNFRTNKLKIYWATKNGVWSKAEPFFLNSDAFSVGHPSLSPDGKTLYFISDMPGGFGGTDIYRCEWKNGQWSNPKNLGASVNSFGNEMFPNINGGKLYFSSDGWPGFGGLDIFCSTLDNGIWSNPENLGLPMNSSFDDFSLVLDKHGKKGFFSSNRPGGVGYDDIYACKQLSKNSKLRYGFTYSGLSKADTITISGYVKDKQTMKPMPGSIVFLLNTVKGKAKVLKTDINGQFKSSIEKGVSYLAKGMENKYLADCISFEIAADDTAHKANTPRDLLLDQLTLNKVFKFNNMNLDIENIYYDFDKWYIRPDAEAELDKLVVVMKENPISIELASHTDCRGSAQYNIDLSQKRAESVVRYIVLQGIDPKRITAKGYGELYLTNPCSDGVPCTPAEHQANRRTEFKVTEFNAPDAFSRFDISKFIAGDDIPAYMFDKDFFIHCLQEGLSKEPTRIEPEKAIQPAKAEPVNAAVPANVIPSTVTEPAKVKSAELNTAKDSKPEINPGVNPASKNEKTSESEVKSEPKSETSGFTYMVQLYALSTFVPLNSAEFANLENVQRYEEGGLYKYTAGIFDNYKEAHAYRDIMVEDGYEGAFVVVFENGKHINMALVNR